MALIVCLLSRDPFNREIEALGSALLAFVFGFVGGCLVNYDGLFRLPLRALRRRIWIAFGLCVALPVGCNRIANIPDISEAEMVAYFREHRAELNELVRLHQTDPNLTLYKTHGTWGASDGGSTNIGKAIALADRLPRVDEVSSIRSPQFEIELTLSTTTDGWFDFTRRGLLYQLPLGEYEVELPAGRSLDKISELDTRYVRTIEGGWRMFHRHISD